MKTYWLTMAGLVALTLVILFVAEAFWLAETKDTRRTGNDI